MTDSPARGAAKEIVECIQEFLIEEGWVARGIKYPTKTLEKEIAAIIEIYQQPSIDELPVGGLFKRQNEDGEWSVHIKLENKGAGVKSRLYSGPHTKDGEIRIVRQQEKQP